MNLKYRNFRDNINSLPSNIPSSQALLSQIPEYEKIKHTLMGSSFAVMRTIRILHELGYADVDEWSPLLPTSNPEEFESILIRLITV
ncbi:MAG: hypothetical protein HC836_32640 [Richelia sp. RM2_1_2]|nr:hypothetical protein [Richelia sp. SM2_1_7]NJM19964.1 hypothetical protein [Richelia sp. SM1_7_0]NJN13744.1 hypothetical protein [Richelia sp. RM1_1_1]NJO62803.1 hypothetical protein [Richelia sp. RM2_1_2]